MNDLRPDEGVKLAGATFIGEAAGDTRIAVHNVTPAGTARLRSPRCVRRQFGSAGFPEIGGSRHHMVPRVHSDRDGILGHVALPAPRSLMLRGTVEPDVREGS